MGRDGTKSLREKDYTCIVGARGRRGEERCSLGKEGHPRRAVRVHVRKAI